jgi:hypothetical protein
VLIVRIDQDPVEIKDRAECFPCRKVGHRKSIGSVLTHSNRSNWLIPY